MTTHTHTHTHPNNTLSIERKSRGGLSKYAIFSNKFMTTHTHKPDGPNLRQDTGDGFLHTKTHVG